MSTTFRHPFAFVPFPTNLPRQDWQGHASGHERISAHLLSGSLQCVLTVVTPLCLKARFTSCQADGLPPILPASSLKGLFRNAAEMLGYGCPGPKFEYTNVARVQCKKKEIPPLDLSAFPPCTADHACLVCRLFGYGVEKSSSSNSDREAFGWSSKLRFFDSLPPGNWKPDSWVSTSAIGCSVQDRQPAKPQDQGPRHAGFYRPDHSGRPVGWKIYRHSSHVSAIASERGSEACVPKDKRFRFRVEFENLTLEELAVLHFVITLTHSCEVHAGELSVTLLHKLGYGKGVGMGSCSVAIESAELSLPRRFFSPEPAPFPSLPCGFEPLFQSAPFAAFRDARAPIPAADTVLLLFPSFHEFKKTPFTASVETFDAYLAQQRFRVSMPRPPAPPLPPPPADLPPQVKCRVTRIKDGQIHLQTTEDCNARKYSTKLSKNLFPMALVPGQSLLLVRVRPASVNHKTAQFDAELKGLKVLHEA